MTWQIECIVVLYQNRLRSCLGKCRNKILVSWIRCRKRSVSSLKRHCNGSKKKSRRKSKCLGPFSKSGRKKRVSVLAKTTSVQIICHNGSMIIAEGREDTLVSQVV